MSKRALKLRAKPWINRKIMKIMNVRDKLLIKYKSSRISTNFSAYIIFRNRVVNEIKNSKNKYYNKYFNDNRNNMKMIWRGIRIVLS